MLVKTSTKKILATDKKEKVSSEKNIVYPENKRNYTPVLMVLLLIASFLLGMLTTKVQYLEKEKVLAATQATQNNQQQAAAPQQPPKVNVSIDMIKSLFNDKNIFFGDKNSKNLLVEVADPSCPYCHVATGLNPTLNPQMGPQFKMQVDGGTYIPPMPQMRELVNNGKAAFVYVYTNGHGAGEEATTALYCAHEQGKFWQVHDLLMNKEGFDFMNNNKLKFDPSQVEISQQGYKKITNDDLNNIVDFLKNTGVNTDQLRECLVSNKYVKKLAEDITTASNLGVSGTPGFFINTNDFLGAYSWKDMQSAVK